MAPLHPPALRCPPHSRQAGAHGFRVRSESAPSRLERPVQGLRCCCGIRCCSLGKNLPAIRTRKESYQRLAQTKNLSATRAGKDRPRIRLHTTPPPPPPRRLQRPGRGGEGGGGVRPTVASRRGTPIGVTPLYGAREAPRDGEASAAACRGPVYAHAVGRGHACAPTKSADVIDSAPPPRAASALITARQRGGACPAP